MAGGMKPSLDLLLAGLVFGAGFALSWCAVQTIWNAAVGAVTRRAG